MSFLTACGIWECVRRGIVRVETCSRCACNRSSFIILVGIRSMDGREPRANSKELSSRLPGNVFDKNHALEMMVSVVALLLSSLNSLIIVLIVPFLRSRMPMLLWRRAGLDRN